MSGINILTKALRSIFYHLYSWIFSLINATDMGLEYYKTPLTGEYRSWLIKVVNQS